MSEDLLAPSAASKTLFLRRRSGSGRCARFGLAFGLVAIFWGFRTEPAAAQLFGERDVGRPLSSPFNRGSGSSSAIGPNVGLLDGSERFVRGNRSRREFVGSDRSEQAGFVGSTQAIGVGRVPAATEGLSIEATDMLRTNRPLPPQTAKGIYYPRLQVDFAVPPREVSQDEVSDQQRLLTRVASVAGGQTEIIMAGRTAILRGIVPTEQAARLAEQLLSFEPGVDRIQNELQVAMP